MLKRISAEQIGQSWDSIKQNLIESNGEFLPKNEVEWEILLQNFLTNRIALHMFEDKDGKIAGLTILSYDMDPVFNYPRVFIYLLNGVPECLQEMLSDIETTYSVSILYTVAGSQDEILKENGFNKTITLLVKEK